jgi:hypothetical protein
VYCRWGVQQARAESSQVSVLHQTSFSFPKTNCQLRSPQKQPTSIGARTRGHTSRVHYKLDSILSKLSSIFRNVSFVSCHTDVARGAGSGRGIVLTFSASEWKGSRLHFDYALVLPCDTHFSAASPTIKDEDRVVLAP